MKDIVCLPDVYAFSPTLFTFDDLSAGGEDNCSRLQHAFAIAEERFGIERLLDVEGRNVDWADDPFLR